MFGGNPFSGGRGCLGEEHLGLPGQVWEPRLSLLLRENRSSINVWEDAWKFQARVHTKGVVRQHAF